MNTRLERSAGNTGPAGQGNLKALPIEETLLSIKDLSKSTHVLFSFAHQGGYEAGKARLRLKDWAIVASIGRPKFDIHRSRRRR